MLLTSLDALYTNLKEVIMYGRDSLTFDEVQSILHARELQKQEESKDESSEGLNIRDRSNKGEKKGKNSRAKSKSRTRSSSVLSVTRKGTSRRIARIGDKTQSRKP